MSVPHTHEPGDRPRLPVDLHAHVLPGLDDGPADLALAVSLCRELVREGVRTVVAAPHVKPTMPCTPALRDAALASLRAELDAARIPLRVLPGGELDLSYATSWTDGELAAFSPDGRLVLIESPWGQWSGDMETTCHDLVERGWRPVIAHPERNAGVQLDASVLDAAIEAGATCHATTEAFTGGFGPRAQASALELVRTERIAFVATDAHDVMGRPPGVTAAWHALRRAGIEEHVIERLFVSAPRQLLNSDDEAAASSEHR